MKIGLPKRKSIFQPLIFRGSLADSFREGNTQTFGTVTFEKEMADSYAMLDRIRPCIG